MAKQVLSVIIPVFNEDRTLATVIEKVLSSTDLMDIELIIVDDGSTDESRSVITEIAQKHSNIRYHFQSSNQGKGAAVRKGIEIASGEWIVIQDADMEYDPHEYNKLLRPALDGYADAVFGSRFASSDFRRVLYYWHSVVNRFLTWLTNILNDLTLTDMETCYKLVRSSIFKQLCLQSNSFAIEAEITTRLAQWDARIYEVPVSYRGRTFAEGKHIRPKDALLAIGALLYYRFVNTRFTNDRGYLVLRAIGRANGFNKMLVDTIRRHIGDRVLEAGCGIGNLTEHLLRKKRLLAVDIENGYVEMIRNKFGHLSNFKAIKMDLADNEAYAGLLSERLDTVICMNVLEHIADDNAVLTNFHNILQPGGRLICLVPQHPGLFGPADKAVAHFRRYTRSGIIEKIEATGFQVTEVREFNRLGIIGWWANNIMKRDIVSAKQIEIYELLILLARFLESIPLLPGLSIIVTGTKL